MITDHPHTNHYDDWYSDCPSLGLTYYWHGPIRITFTQPETQTGEEDQKTGRKPNTKVRTGRPGMDYGGSKRLRDDR